MRKVLTLIVISVTISNSSNAQFRFPDIFGTKKKTPSSTSSTTVTDVLTQAGTILTGANAGGMTQLKASDGLKMALNQGTGFAANNLGAVDGFLANAAVKILFPPEARNVEAALRKIGMGSVCDQFILSVNRAAESAVVEAKPIFAQAITSMSITDAISILTGNQDAATQYLKSTSGNALMMKFEPIIKANLDKVNATKYWSQIMTTYNALPFVTKINPNLSQFVTQKATDGIFLMVAQEELKIRQNPTARIGSILQDVFGWADKQRK